MLESVNQRIHNLFKSDTSINEYFNVTNKDVKMQRENKKPVKIYGNFALASDHLKYAFF